MNAGRVCSDAIAHELNVAALRRLNNAWFTCDAGGGSSLQNGGGQPSAESKRETNGILPPGCTIDDGGHREGGAHRTLQSATVPYSARQPKHNKKSRKLMRKCDAYKPDSWRRSRP